MNYGRLVFAIAVVGLAACAPQKQNGSIKASASNLVEPVGTFKQEDPASIGLTKSYLTIDSDSITRTTICKNLGETVKVVAKSPAQVSSGHFNVLSPSRKVEMIGGTPCVAFNDVGVTAFEVNGPELYITPANGQTVFYGYMVGKRPTTKEIWSKRVDTVKNAVASVPGRVSSGLSALDQGVNNAAVASRAIPGAVYQKSVEMGVALKDSVVERSQLAIDNTKHEAALIGKGLDAADRGVVNAALASNLKANSLHEVESIKAGAIALDQKMIAFDKASRQYIVDKATIAKEQYLKGQAATVDLMKAAGTKVKDGAVKAVMVLGQDGMQQ
jgi:hypothetical protein